MAEPTYEELLERAAVYEHALIRIADKRREFEALIRIDVPEARRVTAWDAYRKSSGIAWRALKIFSPDLEFDDLKRLDLEIRRENGLQIERPKAARRAPAKPRAKRAKGHGKA